MRDAIKLLGERVKERRLSRRLTQESAAARANLDTSYWSQLEGGKYDNPGLRTLQRIADALDTTVAYLSGETDDPNRVPLHIIRRGMPLPPPGAEHLSEEELREIEERARAYEEFEIRRRLREKGIDV